MATGEAKPEPTPEEKRRVEQIAASAQHEVISKNVHDLLMNVRPEDLVEPDPDAEIIKGTANRAGVWAHSPAHLELNAAADRRATRCANWAGIDCKKLERMHARLIKGTKVLVLKPARSTDLSALPVSRYEGSSSAWVNVITLLAEPGLTVDTGCREWFEVAYVPKESPLWPGLFIDLSKPTDRRLEPVTKKAEGTATPKEKKTADKQKKTPDDNTPST